jgi:hypothetical protein
MSQVQIKHYVFNRDEVLGKGSTGTVYLGIYIFIQVLILGIIGRWLLKLLNSKISPIKSPNIFLKTRSKPYKLLTILMSSKHMMLSMILIAATL